MGDDLIGICGDDCASCPRYVAARDGDPALLETVKDLWVRLGLRNVDAPAADLACRGCCPENDCAYPAIRDCASTKAVANCGLCGEYPCELLLEAFARTEGLRERMRGVCSEEETAVLERAFLRKRELLDGIHRESSA